MAGKFTRTARLWREITQIEFRVKRWHKNYEILNQIESHNFCSNFMLIKSNRTSLQTYKIDERTFGTPCKADFNQYYKDNDSLRCSDQTKIKNYVLISGMTKMHLSEMIGKPYLISFYFSFFISLFTNLPPVFGTLPNYPNNTPYPEKVRFFKLDGYNFINTELKERCF